ncbi:MAG: uncharacterized protein QOG20_249 [Pseudonocardiales bacterium]|jgi:predicted RNA-binding protein associated with RNAse of E/G family|nr:uncharacterized protein [Pseudonocardiales bacterium]MDT7704642.1 uncharacterized protein [Pseudonocardiales bacterium]
MHPPKIATFDVPAQVNVDTKGVERPVDEYRETAFGLYMSRAMVDRPTAYWMQTWLLPGLGLAVTDWWWNPGHARDQDFYLDVCDITRAGGIWTLTDHYLDIVVQQRRGAQLVDVDEFVGAVAAALLPTVAAELALHRAARAVDGLAAHGYNLAAWLDGMGIELSWKHRP